MLIIKLYSQFLYPMKQFFIQHINNHTLNSQSHSISNPHMWAMKCLLCIFWEEHGLLYRVFTEKKACDVITVLKLRTICHAWCLWKLAVLQTVIFIMTAKLVKFTRFCLIRWISKPQESFEIHCVRLLGKGSSILNEGPVNLWNDIKAQK